MLSEPMPERADPTPAQPEVAEAPPAGAGLHAVDEPRLVQPAGRASAFPLVPLALALRPHQWVKNLFVAAPLLFAKRLLDPVSLTRALAAVAIFCALSSAVYLINDIVDVERDRAHPKKRHRPIASGRLSVGVARVAAVVLAFVGIAGAVSANLAFAAVAGGYFALNVTYSFALKKVAYVDVLCIALGFLLRVYGGSLAIAVPVSPWLIVCTFSLALFLGFGKRRHELGAAADGAAARSQRAALAGYNLQHLTWMMVAVGVVTIVAYSLYTLAEHTQQQFGTRWLVLTVPCIIFGIYRFAYLVGEHARADSPTEEMLRDAPFLVNVGLWVVLVVGLIYGSKLVR